jgi:CRISPR system Cascade subunit CasE
MFLSRIELGPHAAEHESFWREASRPYGAHQALWTLFSRGPEQKRDFLFRAEDAAGRPTFLVLSAETPDASADGMWRVETKRFEPSLRTGQRLGFRLRASPVVRRAEREGGKAAGRARRLDVVMDLTTSMKRDGQPIPELTERIASAGAAWLEKQARHAGFRLVETAVECIGEDGLLEARVRPALRVEGYRQHRIARRGTSPIQFSTLDFEGVLEVTDPAAFLAQVRAGFGPQKAFGCGLMLLRRA